MSSNTEQFENWKAAIDFKADLLYSEIARIKGEFAALGTEPELIEEFCKPYYQSLKALYSEDYPLAEAFENSDLVVRIDGEGSIKTARACLL